MKDKWMNLCYDDDELKPYIEPEPELNDPKRVDALAAMGHPRDDIEESLRSKKYDDIMANYLLLGKRANEVSCFLSSIMSNKLPIFRMKVIRDLAPVSHFEV